jgi:hypothetical protein
MIWFWFVELLVLFIYSVWNYVLYEQRKDVVYCVQFVFISTLARTENEYVEV